MIDIPSRTVIGDDDGFPRRRFRHLLTALVLTIASSLAPVAAPAQSGMMWAARGMSGAPELEVSGDGSMLMTSHGYTVRGWSTADGSLVRSQPGFSLYYGFRGAFSRGARYFANVAQDAKLTVYDGTSLAPLDSTTLASNLGLPLRLLFSPDGSRLLAIGQQRVALYSIPELDVVWTVTSSPATAAAFSRDGSLIAWNERDQLALFRATTGGLVRRFEGAHAVDESGFAAGDAIVVGYNGREIVTWNVWDGTFRQIVSDREIADGHRMVIDPDGARAVTYSINREADSTMRVWRIDDGARIHDFGLSGLQFPLGKAVFDGGRLVVTTSIGTAAWIDTADGSGLRSIGTGTGTPLAVISFLGSDVVAAGADRMMRFYDGATGALLRLYPIAGDLLGFSRDGASWIEHRREADDDTLRLMETSSGRLLRAYPIDLVEVGPIAISDDLQRVAWRPGRGDVIHVDELATGRRLQSLQCVAGTTRDLIFSPNGKLLAEVGDVLIGLWRLDDGSLVKKVYGPGPAGFSPSGREIIQSHGGAVQISSIEPRLTEARWIATSPSPNSVEQSFAMTSDERWLIHSSNQLLAISYARGIIHHDYVDPKYVQLAYGYAPATIDRREETFVTHNMLGDIVRWRMSGVLAAPDDGRTTGADLTVIPSTAHDHVRIAFDVQSGGKQTLELVSATGERVLSRSLAHDMGPAVEIVDVGELPSGLYLVSLRMGERRLTGRVVASH
jgi:WD40 repeat protein